MTEAGPFQAFVPASAVNFLTNSVVLLSDLHKHKLQPQTATVQYILQCSSKEGKYRFGSLNVPIFGAFELMGKSFQRYVCYLDCISTLPHFSTYQHMLSLKNVCARP